MFGGPNPYFDESNGPNVWEYYFEPIGPSFAELSALVKDGKVLTLSTASELGRLYRWEPKSWFMNPYGYFRSVENYADGNYPAKWWQAQRNKARAFLQDGTLRFNSFILDQVKRFAEANFSEETLALQLRGSDKFDFGAGPNLARKVLPEEYFPHIDRYLSEHPKCARIFVATDQRQWLKLLQERYSDRILSFSEWSLSDSDSNRFHDAQGKATRGAEVLVDLLLLSRCNFLLKCHAGVGEMALVLNPDLDFLDLNYAAQRYQATSLPLRAVIAPAIKSICSVWSRLAENGMALTKVLSIDEDRILVDHASPRPLNTKESANEKAPRPPVLSTRFVSGALERALQVLSDLCFEYHKDDALT
jgi:hypothetical protein